MLGITKKTRTQLSEIYKERIAKEIENRLEAEAKKAVESQDNWLKHYAPGDISKAIEIIYNNLGKNADSTAKKTKIILEAEIITDIDFQMCHIKTAVVASISDEYSVSCRAIVEDGRLPCIEFSITW